MDPPRGRVLEFSQDATNEQVIVAAALVDVEFAADALRRYPPDTFLTPEHQVIWGAMREARARQLAFDPTTLVRLSGGGVDVSYLVDLLRARPDVPDASTLKFAVDTLLWDRQRHAALTGPLSQLLEALQKAEGPDRVRGLSEAVRACFVGWGDRRHLHDPEALVRTQVADLRARMQGRAIYPYGLQGLDLNDEAATDRSPRRMVPGAAPGQVTVVTGVPGSGKSTFTCRLVLGLARQRRRVLYGAWEMFGGPTLELLACQSLAEQDAPPGDWSRTKLTVPCDYPGWMTDERVEVLERRMGELSQWVRFLDNPFRRGTGGKPSNARNLDLVAGYIADSGCQVFVADLWKRCLVETRPEDEEEALYRQQAMLGELGVHGVLVQQQRSKDIEARLDKRPTREGIKGSGAWTEVADTILGLHRQALWKPVTDDKLEGDILKQRYGRWPIGIEFDWQPDKGLITGGVTIPYEMTSGQASEASRIDQMTGVNKPRGRGR